MLPKINPTSTSSWRALTQHHAEIKNTKIKDLFAADTSRFPRLSVQSGDILFDYSKNIITDKTLELLQNLAAETKVKESIDAMFNGDIINDTEHRSVLHTALRNFSKQPVYSEGNDVMPL